MEGEYQAALNRMGRATIGLPNDTARHSSGGERTHPGEGPPRPPTGALRLAAPGSTRGRRGAGGDPREAGGAGREAERSSRASE